jgi:uncharacterized membrane protein
MEHWQIAFTGHWPAALIGLGALVAACLAYVCYRRRKPGLRPRTFWALATLRTAAIGVIAVFMLQPVLRLIRTQAEDATVAVLVDVSESMGIRDSADDRTRLESALQLLTGRPSEILDKLSSGSLEVRAFSFGAVTAPLADPDRVGELRASQKATAIGDALKEVVRTIPREQLAGIVLLTDGVSNRGDDPGKVAQGLGVPVFPVVLGGAPGEKGRFHDVGIAELPAAPQFIVNNTATVKVRISHAGLGKFLDAERQLQLRLMGGEQELASQTVAFPLADGTLEQDLSFVPERVGIHRLTVKLDSLPNETVTENNERSFTVQVTDPRIRVLIVEGVIRSEYRFLRRVLESDPNLEVTGVIKLSGRRFMVQGVQPGVDLDRGLPARQEDYGKFDVVVLGDIDREEFSGLQLEYLKEFVAGGGALLALGGYHSFGAGGYADTPVADLLPVTLGGKGDGQAEDPFIPVLTAAGRSHPVFQGCEGFFEGAQEAVELDGANRVTGAKPGAEVLAVHPVERAGRGPMPVVAVQSFGAGRTMALTADTTWKWKFQVEARGQDSPYYRFWRQAMRWLAGRRGEEMTPDQRVNGWTARPEYEPGERVILKAKVRDAEGQPEERAEVTVALSYPIPVRREGPGGEEAYDEGTTVKLEPVPLSLGEYQTPWDPPASGLYQATASAAKDGVELGSDPFEFVVGRAASEFDRVDVDEQLLQSLAGQTGGVFHRLTTAGSIPDELEQRRNLVAHRREINLWNAPWLLAVFLACVTGEWVLRKRRGLN